MNDQEQIQLLDGIFKNAIAINAETLSDLFVVIESLTNDCDHFNETSRTYQQLTALGFECQEFGANFSPIERKFFSYWFCKRTNECGDLVPNIKIANQHTITVLPDIAWAIEEQQISVAISSKSRGGQAAGIRHQEVIATHEDTGLFAEIAYGYLGEKRLKVLAHDFLMATMFLRLKQLRKKWA